MSSYFILPVVQATIGTSPNTQTVNIPKYSATDSTPLFSDFTSIPYGNEGFSLIALASANANLSSEPDVFSFSSDLTLALTDQDVSNIDAYFAGANIPSDFVTTGMAWSDVLQQTAQIFLLAEALSGATGQPIFNGTGLTLDSTVGSASQSSGKIKGGGTAGATTSALATAVEDGSAGVFDLSGVDSSSSISDALISVSQQFSSPIVLGAVSL
jgi:hypothetical protein